jgi:hypothetical protein
VTEAVLVFKSAINHDGDDLHVSVAVHAETFAGRDDVIVDDP